MSTLADFSADDLLAQATCAVLTENQVKGTAWLVSDEGYLLTAGHVLGKKEDGDEVEIRFAEDIPRKAYVFHKEFYPEIGTDFAILKLTEPPAARHPPPISLAQSVKGKFRLRGYGVTLKDQSGGEGVFLSPLDPQGFSGNRLFVLDSKQLGEKGYSGAAVYSDELQAVVAVQIEATTACTGAGSDTVLAMPLYRIGQRWKLLFHLGRDEYNIFAIRKLFIEALGYEEFTYFSHHHYKDVYQQIESGMTLPSRVDMLIDYCSRTGSLDDLLQLVKDLYPKEYAKFGLSKPKTVKQEIEDLRRLVENKYKMIFDLELQRYLCGLHPLPDLLRSLEIEREELHNLRKELMELGVECEPNPLNNTITVSRGPLREEVRKHSSNEILEIAVSAVNNIRASYKSHLKKIENLQAKVRVWKELHHALHSLYFIFNIFNQTIRDFAEHFRPVDAESDERTNLKQFNTINRLWESVRERSLPEIETRLEALRSVEAALLEVESKELEKIRDRSNKIELSMEEGDIDQVIDLAREFEDANMNLLNSVDQKLLTTIGEMNRVFNNFDI